MSTRLKKPSVTQIGYLNRSSYFNWTMRGQRTCISHITLLNQLNKLPISYKCKQSNHKTIETQQLSTTNSSDDQEQQQFMRTVSYRVTILMERDKIRQEEDRDER